MELIKQLEIEITHLLEASKDNENVDCSNIVNILQKLMELSLKQKEIESILNQLNKIPDREYNFYLFKAYFHYHNKNKLKWLSYHKTQILLDFYAYQENKSTSSDFIFDIDSISAFININIEDNIQLFDALIEDEEIKNDIECQNLLYANKYVSSNKLEDALEYFFKVYTLNKNNWYALYFIGVIYYIQRNLLSSINYLEKTLQILNNSSSVNKNKFISDCQFYIANNYSLQKNFVKESEAYYKCLAIESSYPYAKNNLGYSLLRQGKLNESLQIFNECIKEKNDGEFPLLNKIRVLKKMRKYDEALKFIESIKVPIKSKKTLLKLKTELLSLKNKQEVNNEVSTKNEIEENPAGKITPIKITPINIAESLNNQKEIENEKMIEIFLEQRILNNQEVLEKKLKMYQANDGTHGRQFYTPIGRIDLLTIDVDTNDFVIIELKKGKSDDEVSGQIMRYIN